MSQTISYATSAALLALDSRRKRLANVEPDTFAQFERLSFPVLATLREHREMEANFRSTSAVDSLRVYPDPEDE
jgi:hypothetical protein